MKALRFLLSLTLLAGLTFIQVPQTAQCQMSMGMPRAICQMSCCKTPLGAAQCPMLKVSPHHEAVTTFTVSVQPYILALETVLPKAPLLRGSRIQGILSTIASLLSLAPPLGRAPPSDVVLFAA